MNTYEHRPLELNGGKGCRGNPLELNVGKGLRGGGDWLFVTVDIIFFFNMYPTLLDTGLNFFGYTRFFGYR